MWDIGLVLVITILFICVAKLACQNNHRKLYVVDRLKITTLKILGMHEIINPIFLTNDPNLM